MITLRSIRYKNFIATGNVFTEIPLHRYSHTLIIGENGVGKSAILDSICFALFNRPFRKVNKPNLVNSINGKNCIVECDFEIDNDTYIIRRGLKPAIFEIFQNGKLIEPEAANRDYQDYLETVILKMNFKTFTQIVCLGSASYIPFMQLTALERRAVIEDLLDIQIFSTIHERVKLRLTDVKTALATNRQQLDSLQDKIKLQEKHVAALTGNRDSLTNSLLEEKTLAIELLEKQYSEFAKITKTLTANPLPVKEKNQLVKYQNELTEIYGRLKRSITKQIKSLNFFKDNNDCPTCTRPMDEAFRAQSITDIQQKIDKAQEGESQIQNAIATTIAKIQSLETQEKEHRQLTEQLRAVQIQKEYIQKQLDSVEGKLQSISVQHHDNITTELAELESFKQNLQALTEERKQQTENQAYLDLAYHLLKDGGIKTQIINQYLPVINAIINKYLQSLDFSVNFLLNQEFEETIKSRYRDEFQYASFSEGEKQRIDMAMMLTWRAIAKIKNSGHINLLILDEVFDSSLDINGTEELLKLLSVLEESNVFVISHRGEILQDKFQHVIRFKKLHSFSQMVTQ